MLVQHTALSAPVSRDADDDQAIACALSATANLIVSGDSDLLDLGQHQGISILTAARALDTINADNRAGR